LDGASVHGTVTISGTATDANRFDILVVEVNIDDRGWVPVGGVNPWEYYWETGDEPDGQYTIQARAGDGRLFSEVATINITVLHPVPGISITPPTGVDSVFPGDNVDLIFKVVNVGTGIGKFILVATTVPTINAKVTPKEVTIEPGNETDVKVTVPIDWNTEPNTQVTVTLSGKEENDPSIAAQAKVTIDIIPDPARQSVILKEPADGKGKPGEFVTYIFVVRNNGNVPDTYTISASSPSDWKVTLKIGKDPIVGGIEIEDGKTVELEVNVKIPDNAKARTLETITITVQSDNFDNSKDEKSVQTTVQGKKVSDNVVAIPTPVVSVVATCMVFGVIAGIIGGTEWGKYGFFWLLIPLYSRLKKEAVLDNFKRGEINAFIKLNPGTYYNEIKKHLGVSNGVLTYHLNKLEAEGYIKAKNNGRYKHYFPANMRIPKKIIILNELQRGLLKFIGDYKSVTQANISEHFDLPVPTVSRHLRRLLDAEMISVEKRGKLNFYSVSAPVEGEGENQYTGYDDYYTKVPPDQQP
jgi:DNA-binding transcriptional ArsR family regulator